MQNRFVPAFVHNDSPSHRTVICRAAREILRIAALKAVGENLIHGLSAKPFRRVEVPVIYSQLKACRRLVIYYAFSLRMAHGRPHVKRFLRRFCNKEVPQNAGRFRNGDSLFPKICTAEHWIFRAFVIKKGFDPDGTNIRIFCAQPQHNVLAGFHSAERITEAAARGIVFDCHKESPF